MSIDDPLRQLDVNHALLYPIDRSIEQFGCAGDRVVVCARLHPVLVMRRAYPSLVPSYPSGVVIISAQDTHHTHFGQRTHSWPIETSHIPIAPALCTTIRQGWGRLGRPDRASGGSRSLLSVCART